VATLLLLLLEVHSKSIDIPKGERRRVKHATGGGKEQTDWDGSAARNISCKLKFVFLPRAPDAIKLLCVSFIRIVIHMDIDWFVQTDTNNESKTWHWDPSILATLHSCQADNIVHPTGIPSYTLEHHADEGRNGEARSDLAYFAHPCLLQEQRNEQPCCTSVSNRKTPLYKDAEKDPWKQHNTEENRIE
jgi:hypothetical protein